MTQRLPSLISVLPTSSSLRVLCRSAAIQCKLCYQSPLIVQVLKSCLRPSVCLSSNPSIFCMSPDYALRQSSPTFSTEGDVSDFCSAHWLSRPYKVDLHHYKRGLQIARHTGPSRTQTGAVCCPSAQFRQYVNSAGRKIKDTNSAPI